MSDDEDFFDLVGSKPFELVCTKCKKDAIKADGRFVLSIDPKTYLPQWCFVCGPCFDTMTPIVNIMPDAVSNDLGNVASLTLILPTPNQFLTS